MRDNRFINPLFTVDSVLFTVVEQELRVLLVRRAIEPFTGLWSLPGGFVDVAIDATTDDTALRKLEAKTGVRPPYLEQLCAFSGADRDPRGYSVTLAYYALIADAPTAPHIDTVDAASWVPVSALSDMALAFDHAEIIHAAFTRLQQKTLYSMLPVFCCPERFTVTQLMQVIEAIIEKPVQRKSLMRRIESSDMFEFAGEKVSSGGRSAQLYRLKSGVDLMNFERNLGA